MKIKQTTTTELRKWHMEKKKKNKNSNATQMAFQGRKRKIHAQKLRCMVALTWRHLSQSMTANPCVQQLWQLVLLPTGWHSGRRAGILEGGTIFTEPSPSGLLEKILLGSIVLNHAVTKLCPGKSDARSKVLSGQPPPWVLLDFCLWWEERWRGNHSLENEWHQDATM